MAEIETVANNLVEDNALLGVLLSCPHCAKTYQLVNPQEGLVYQCQKCQSQFLVRKESNGRFQALSWSEEQILKILFDVPGETGMSQLVRAWKNTFENLGDLKCHEQFVYLCRQKNNLSLAKEKYKQLSIYLNWDGLPEYLKVIIEPNRIKLSPWAERMPWVVLGLSGLLVLLGSVLQGQRNMIGAGVLVFVLDFLIYRKRFKVFFREIL
jgi:DNA-directed RNA polymerase subunit RPC12/RpoP